MQRTILLELSRAQNRNATLGPTEFSLTECLGCEEQDLLYYEHIFLRKGSFNAI